MRTAREWGIVGLCVEDVYDIWEALQRVGRHFHAPIGFVVRRWSVIRALANKMTAPGVAFSVQTCFPGVT